MRDTVKNTYTVTSFNDEGRNRVVTNVGDKLKDAMILANLCGRGDKDIFTVADALGVEL